MKSLALLLHSRHAIRLLWGFVVAIVLIAAWSRCSVSQQEARTKDFAVERKKTGSKSVTTEEGRREFETRCSGCHGLDGRGGEQGPNISTSGSAQQRSQDDMFKIIHDGMPAKGMPAFDYLRDGEIQTMVRYIRYLGGQVGAEPVKGSPVRGAALFFGKAGCGNCHMIRGKGGFLASDLTDFAQSHTPRAIKEAILNPAKFRDRKAEMVEIVIRGGERLSGAIRNEDNFSLQILGVEGAFHLVMKSEVEHVNHGGSGIMPTDYDRLLSRIEMDDLVACLSEGSRGPMRKSVGTKSDRHPNATTGKSPNK